MPFIGKSPQVGAFQLIDSITTSATDTYAMAVSGSAYVPESARNLIVSLNGVTQAPETAYTVSSSNIVFASALTASDVIDYILVIGDAVDIGTPSDNTVGDAQLKAALDLSSKTLTLANDQISGDVINGGTISSFASTGIDDNANANAITIDSSENVGIGTSGSISAPLHIGRAASGTYSIFDDGANGRFTFASVTGSTNENRIFSTTTGFAGYEDLNIVADNFLFSTGGPTGVKMKMASSGNVSIGTTVTTKGRLTVQGVSPATNNNTLALVSAAGSSKKAGISFYGSFVSPTTDTTPRRVADITAGFSTTNWTTEYMAFHVGIGASNDAMALNTERMRIDGAGNLLVGTTQHRPATNNVNGVSIDGTFGIEASVTSGGPLTLNRKSTDGGIISLKKDGTTLGVLGSEGGDSLYVQGGTTSGAGLLCHGGAAKILPVRNGASIDATIDLGQDSRRFKDMYLSGGAYLGGTASANHLDDYEEGDWLPTITGNSGASGQTYSAQRGRYRKIGNVVHITFDTVLTNVGSISGTYIVLGSLPFAGMGGNVGGGITVTYSSGWSSSLQEPILGYISGSLCYLMEGGSTGNDYVLANNNFHSSSSRLIGYGTIILS